MKIWLFALLQSIIGLLGLAAFFLADNVFLTKAAAVAAALLGIAQPLLSARKGHKQKLYQDQQWNRSAEAVDEQLNAMLADVIDPPLPHRETVSIAMRNRFGDRAPELMGCYDKAVDSITEASAGSEAIVSRFAEEVQPWSLGAYLQGLDALRLGDADRAYQYFRTARDAQRSWILPWLGWAVSAYRQGSIDEIRQDHPHVNGVELEPYDAGDESTFLELSNDARDELANRFQRAATSLGNYYTIAEFCNSKQQIAAARDEYNKAA